MSLFSKLLNRKPVAEAPAILPLPELLVKAVKRMSETDKDVEVEAATLALELRERSADYKNVRAIATDIVYEGDSDSAEKLMNLLARYGFGDGAITVKQPERIERKTIPEALQSPVPNLHPENLFLELALSPDAYAAVLLGDSGTGLTTLIQALIGAALRHPCPGISITVLDFVGEPDWQGLATVPNALAVLSSRDKKFLEIAADYIGQIAKEIQQRHAQRTIKQRSSSLGSNRWPTYFLAVNGWQLVSEALERFTSTQIQQHPYAAQLLADFKYCLASGPKVGVTVVVSGDRIENMGISQTALDTARLFALGAVHSPGIGGYRAVDALLTNANRIPDLSERKALKALLSEAKALGLPVVLALSGVPRLGELRDFRDAELNLGEMYKARRGS